VNLETTDEQRELRNTVRRFLAERASISEHVRHALDGAVDPGVWAGLAALGATGLLVPEDVGGSGLSMSDAVVIAEETGAALLPEPWLSSAVAAPRAIQRFSAEDAAAELLAGIAEGTLIATVALPDGEQPLRATGSTLSGELTGVRDAGVADVVLVTAPHRDGVALYRVDATAPGVVITAEPGIDQTCRMFRVFCTDVQADLLATADVGAAGALVDDVFVVTAADALGTAQHLLDSVVQYTKTRTQFGRPIGSFQAVAHLCVDMYETVELARSGVLHAAWAADEAASDERHLAAWRLKAFAARLASVGDTAVQVFGGIGFTWEHDAHLHLKRLLSWSSLVGGSDPYLEEVGDLFVKSVAT
jgi:alkylation response protein AidB-like acyl-CoA dehydrogenase